jgi:hypothetical protein
MVTFIGFGVVPKLLVAVLDPKVEELPKVLPPNRAIFGNSLISS